MAEPSTPIKQSQRPLRLRSAMALVQYRGADTFTAEDLMEIAGACIQRLSPEGLKHVIKTAQTELSHRKEFSRVPA
jgi:hypothetical protein